MAHHRHRRNRGKRTLKLVMILLGVVVLGAIAIKLLWSKPNHRMVREAEIAQLKDQAVEDMKGFKVALLFYKADAGDFPTTAQGLMAMVEKPSLEPIPKRFTQRMKEVPSDPWGNPYVYRWPAAEH